MKKIGILTLNGNFNYGNKFQNYATQKFFNDFGYETETIRYHYKESDKGSKILNFFKHLFNLEIIGIIKYKIYLKKNSEKIAKKNKLLKKREVNFKKFTSEYINETEYTLDQNIVNDVEMRKSINNEYLSFFSGSDQVWNLDSGHFPKMFFLPFVNDKRRRNSFAASFGVNEIGSKWKPEYEKYLKSMNNISVREKSGQTIVKKLTDKKCTLLLDPVFLLSKEEWLSMAEETPIPSNDGYVLTYFIGEKTDRYNQILKKISKNQNLKIINLNDINDPNYFDISPSQFIFLLNASKFVFTDSFHGVAMSIIFNKPFMVVDRIDINHNMNTRIISVLERFDLSSRYLKSKSKIDFENWIKPLDNEKIDKIIKDNKGETISFVSDSLASVEIS